MRSSATSECQVSGVTSLAPPLVSWSLHPSNLAYDYADFVFHSRSTTARQSKLIKLGLVPDQAESFLKELRVQTGVSSRIG